jgi:signal transduction histidine kinase
MRLSDFITANLEAILNEWEAFAKEFQAAQGMNSKELRDHARQMLETIAKDLAMPQTENDRKEKSKGHGHAKGHADNEESAPERHALERAKSGFSIEDLIAEYRALRASVLRLWGESADTVHTPDLDDMTRFNEAIDQAVAEAVGRYSSMVKQAQDLFLGILGHDLRNPLGAITTSARFLMQDATLDSRYIKTASIIYNSGTKMSRLIDDLLAYTRTRLGQSMPISPSQADLADIVRQSVMEACAFHPDRTISFDAAGDLHGHWDSARIGQVFSNLIGNAIQYGSDSEPINVVLSAQGEDVVATVHNSGNPIPEDDIPHIFEPMRRSLVSSTGNRQDASLGLGLYITREIIQAHGGTVNVASSMQDGTTFTVRVPRRYMPAQERGG